MNSGEAEKEIRSRIEVSHQKVVIAKAIILEAAKTSTRTSDLIDAVLRANEAPIPRQVVLHPSVDSIAAVDAAGRAL